MGKATIDLVLSMLLMGLVGEGGASTCWKWLSHKVGEGDRKVGDEALPTRLRGWLSTDRQTRSEMRSRASFFFCCCCCCCCIDSR